MSFDSSIQDTMIISFHYFVSILYVWQKRFTVILHTYSIECLESIFIPDWILDTFFKEHCPQCSKLTFTCNCLIPTMVGYWFSLFTVLVIVRGLCTSDVLCSLGWELKCLLLPGPATVYSTWDGGLVSGTLRSSLSDGLHLTLQSVACSLPSPFSPGLCPPAPHRAPRWCLTGPSLTSHARVFGFISTYLKGTSSCVMNWIPGREGSAQCWAGSLGWRPEMAAMSACPGSMWERRRPSPTNCPADLRHLQEGGAEALA